MKSRKHTSQLILATGLTLLAVPTAALAGGGAGFAPGDPRSAAQPAAAAVAVVHQGPAAHVVHAPGGPAVSGDPIASDGRARPAPARPAPTRPAPARPAPAAPGQSNVDAAGAAQGGKPAKPGSDGKDAPPQAQNQLYVLNPYAAQKLREEEAARVETKRRKVEELLHLHRVLVQVRQLRQEREKADQAAKDKAVKEKAAKEKAAKEQAEPRFQVQHVRIEPWRANEAARQIALDELAREQRNKQVEQVQLQVMR